MDGEYQPLFRADGDDDDITGIDAAEGFKDNPLGESAADFSLLDGNGRANGRGGMVVIGLGLVIGDDQHVANNLRNHSIVLMDDGANDGEIFVQHSGQFPGKSFSEMVEKPSISANITVATLGSLSPG